MINEILSVPKNLLWFLPCVIAFMLILYKCVYNSIHAYLSTDREAQRRYLAEEDNVPVELITDEILDEAIDYASIFYGNCVLFISGITIVLLILFGF